MRLSIEINGALLLPWLKVLDFVGSLWILHPLDDLRHRDKVNVAVIGQDLIDPVQEGVEEFGIVLEPCSVEVEAEWGAI